VTEILIDVDFGHPPERVWRALTDRAVLSEWFMRTDLEPYEGRRFRLMPDGLLGLAGPLEGELVEVVAPRRLVMLWRGEQLHSRVTWELVPLPDGCRLRMSHTGFIGVKGSVRRKELQRTYDRMLADRLPRTLDRLATGRIAAEEPASAAYAPPLVEVPRLANGPDPADRPDDGGPDERPDDGASRRRTGIAGRLRALPYRRRGQLLAVGAAVLLAVVTAAVFSGLRVPSLIPPLGTAPEPWPTLSPGAAPSAGVPPPLPASPGASVGPSGPIAGGLSAPAESGRPGGSANPDRAVPPAAGPTSDPSAGAPTGFAAAYRTVSSTGSGFTGELTVTNTGTRPARGWSVVVTLPAGAGLTTVRSATAAQSGTTVTFTSRNAGSLPAGRSVTIEFQVRGDGATGPTGCRVGGDPCGGLG
jgi:uncharacterized protein YndB with AHSA1/START domain